MTADPAPLESPVDPIDPTPDVPAAQPGGDAPADQLSLLRDLIARAYPNAVPELIQGDTLDDMLASLPQAQAAWSRITEAATATTVASPSPNPVPAGSAVCSTQLDPGTLSPLAKIRHGLARE